MFLRVCASKYLLRLFVKKRKVNAGMKIILRLRTPRQARIFVPHNYSGAANGARTFCMFRTSSSKYHTSFHSHGENWKYVDKYAMVSISLVDNRLSGAKLPCHPNTTSLWKIFRKPRLSVFDFLTSRNPEECTVRWTVSFLARFGSEWLISSSNLVKFKEEQYRRDLKIQDLLPKRLFAFIACCVTR